MVNRPSVPEIITVNSEDLQTTIRDLLPSQNGFGSELQATNVITPIIDLTATAEGSGLPANLQTAIAFGSQTAFLAQNSTETLATSPGFYRVTAAASGVGGGNNSFQMTDGSSTKIVWNIAYPASANYATNVDYTFWLDAGITLTAVSSSAAHILQGSVRQIADSTGSLVQPSGFPL